VCSGIGIPNIYDYVREDEGIQESPDVSRSISSAKDRTKAIVAAGLDPDRPSEACHATMEIFVSILAAEAGNLALKVMSTGGVYIAGGVAFHSLRALQAPRFMEVFMRKGRFRSMMERLPVSVITTRAALLGAAAYGLEALSRPPGSTGA
jgi:glucokinase